VTTDVTPQEHADAALAALADGRWEDARDAFAAVLAENVTPEALEGMGEALWWLGDPWGCVDYRTRAFAAYRREGHDGAAAVVALQLSVVFFSSLGNEVAAQGWLARAESLGAADDGDLRGWYDLVRGYTSPDVQLAVELARRALEDGRRLQDRDLELCALCDLGLALVRSGSVGEGLSLIDEGMAGTLAGEYTRLDTVVFACCDMLEACDAVADVRRATHWCRVADAFMAQYGCPFLNVECRTLYGSVLASTGNWSAAEGELLTALSIAGQATPALRARASAALARLRLRQGHLDEAEALVTGIDEPWDAQVLAEVLLAQGKPAAAAAKLDGVLTRYGNQPLVRASVLEALVGAQLATADSAAAHRCSAELVALADEYPHLLVQARAEMAAARLAGTESPRELAVAHLHAALRHFDAAGLVYEAARARHELARALIATQPEAAAVEATQALTVFRHLGAARDADATSALLRELGVPTPPGPRSEELLSAREQEVFALLTAGLSNPEIARRLFISRKTAAHHVSRVITKLGLRNRTEVAAFGARQDRG
jgi:DNA-binding NarL/FixJ family response regulator/tetratricopeptide (TPR) repeat protein